MGVRRRQRWRGELRAERGSEALHPRHLVGNQSRAERPGRELVAGQRQVQDFVLRDAGQHRRQHAPGQCLQARVIGKEGLVVLQFLLGGRQRKVQTLAEKQPAGVAEELQELFEADLAPFGGRRFQRREKERQRCLAGPAIAALVAVVKNVVDRRRYGK